MATCGFVQLGDAVAIRIGSMLRDCSQCPVEKI